MLVMVVNPDTDAAGLSTQMVYTSSTQDMKVQKNGFVKRSKAKKPRKNYGMVAHSSLTFFPTGAKVVFLIQRKNKQTSEKQDCGQIFISFLIPTPLLHFFNHPTEISHNRLKRTDCVCGRTKKAYGEKLHNDVSVCL